MCVLASLEQQTFCCSKVRWHLCASTCLCIYMAPMNNNKTWTGKYLRGTVHVWGLLSLWESRRAVCVVTVVLHRSAAAPCLSAAFFFLLQFWKSSHCCCIDTPVEGPGEESREPAVQPECLSFRALHPWNSPPLTWSYVTYLYMLIIKPKTGTVVYMDGDCSVCNPVATFCFTVARLASHCIKFSLSSPDANIKSSCRTAECLLHTFHVSNTRRIGAANYAWACKEKKTHHPTVPP